MKLGNSNSLQAVIGFSRFFVRISLAVTAMLMCYGLAFGSAVVEVSGSSKIHNNNLIQADQAALNNALLEAIKEYYQFYAGNNPTLKNLYITPQFFRFVNSYRVLRRYVYGDNVVYHLEVSIDTEGLSHPLVFLKQKNDNLIIYGFHYDADDITKGEFVINNTLDDAIQSVIAKAGLDLKYQPQYSDNRTPNLSVKQVEDILNASQAKYAYYFMYKLSSKVDPEDKHTYCVADISTTLIGRGGGLETLNGSGEYFDSDIERCFHDLSEGLAERTLIELNKHNNVALKNDEIASSHNYSIVFHNMPNFVTVQDTIKLFSERKYFFDVVSNELSSTEMSYKAKSYFDSDKIAGILNQYRVQDGVDIKVSKVPSVLSSAPVDAALGVLNSTNESGIAANANLNVTQQVLQADLGTNSSVNGVGGSSDVIVVDIYYKAQR